MAALQQIWKNVGRSTGVESQVSGKSEAGTSNDTGKENRLEGGQQARTERADLNEKVGSAGKAAKTAGKSVAKNVAGTATRQISMKAVALLVAGTVGVGGITYSMVKHADSLSFMSQVVKLEESETEQITLLETECETEPQSELVIVTPKETEIESQSETQTEAQSETQTETQSEIQTKEAETESSIPENVITQGNYGDNVQWYLDAEGTLTVNGQGVMADASIDTQTGWDTYQNQITKIVIGEGITRIGNNTFDGFGYVNSIEMSDTVTEIGDNAFSGVIPASADPGVKRSVKLSASLEKIGDYAFWCSNITAIDLPDNVREIGERALGRLYFMDSLNIGPNSQLETVGVQAFEQDGINTPLQNQNINIPSTLRCIKSEAFPAGDYADTVTFSASLQELGLGAFAYGATGLRTIYFQGNAPAIIDEQVVSIESTVFPDTTTDVYYPERNVTWNGFDFSKLGVNVIPHSYDTEEKIIAIPHGAVAGISETESEKEDVTEAANERIDARSLYQEFYEKYVADEKLRVIENGWQNDDYDRNTGYTQDMLLAAYINDFGGDGNQELLIVRTIGGENEYGGSVMSQKINLELYGIDEQEITLRQALSYDSSNLNEGTVCNREQIAVQKGDNDYYLYRYAMYHPGAGVGSYDNTIVKITDQELIQVWDLQYTSFTGAYGACIVNGEDHYTGNADADIGYLNSILQSYGLEAYQEMLNIPCIVYMTRNEILNEKNLIFYQDIFWLTNCFQ